MVRSFIAVVLALGLCAGCSVVRLKYVGEVKTPDGQKSTVMYEKTYPVGGALQELCIISGVFLGGSCWYFLVMPTTAQRQTLEADALAFARRDLKNDTVTIQMISADPVDWKEGEVIGSITPMTPEVVKPPLAAPPAPAQ